MTAIFFPLRTEGTEGAIHPFSQAASISDSSFSLMVTGLSFSPQTQAVSHSAGQTLPVNSGKLLVFKSRERPCLMFPEKTSSFHSGIRFLSGHPNADWQKGTPQFMQRAPCSRLSASFKER